MANSNNKPLVVSTGEPAGIGPDLCLQLVDETTPLIVIADPEQMQQRAHALGQTFDWPIYDADNQSTVSGVQILPVSLANPNVCGTPDPANSEALLDGLRRAVSGCLSSEFAGLVTGPLQKSTINDAGIAFSGHTEFLAELCGVEQPVMLLTADRLRVALVSTHLPLSEVPKYVTAERILAVIRVLHHDLVSRFGIADPDIVVCGLNPHAGEGGHLGSEDNAVIKPAVRILQQQGINVRGPVPADTAFTPAAGKPDAIVAMYHDQGLPVLKYAGFGNAVNVTLGLPIIRTSVDHGTALDIAGSGRAETGSLFAAIELAAQMAAV